MDLLMYAFINIGVLLNALVINNVRRLLVETVIAYQKALESNTREIDEEIHDEAFSCEEKIRLIMNAAVIINVVTSVMVYSLVFTGVASVTKDRMFGLYGFVGMFSFICFFISIVKFTECRNKCMNYSKDEE